MGKDLVCEKSRDKKGECSLDEVFEKFGRSDKNR